MTALPPLITLPLMEKSRLTSAEVQAVLAEAEREGIDLSLLRERLRLTPTERLEHNRRFLRFVLDVREAGTTLRRR